MKVLGINATYLGRDKMYAQLSEEPIMKTRRMLGKIRNLSLSTSYTHGINKIKNSCAYDAIITSFTPYSIIHPSDQYNSIINSHKNLREFKNLNESYFTAYLYLDYLIKLNPFAKFIIYSGAYSESRKPSEKETNFLNQRLKNYTWVNKTDDYQKDKKILENSLVESLSEFRLTLNEDNVFVFEPSISRAPVQLDFDNPTVNLITKLHFDNPNLIYSAQIEEFNYLINKPKVGEETIHKFLEAHPQFLLGSRYRSLRSKVQLKRDHKGPLIPDFILEPVNQNDFWKIIDLKIPEINITRTPLNRDGFNAQIINALNQLKKYRNYFDNHVYRQRLSDVGINAYKPIISIIIGLDYGNLSYEEIIEAKEPFQNYNFEIMTFNDVLEQANNMMLFKK